MSNDSPTPHWEWKSPVESYQDGLDLLRGRDRPLIPLDLRIELHDTINAVTAWRARIQNRQGWDPFNPPLDLARSLDASVAAVTTVGREVGVEAIDRVLGERDCQSYEESVLLENFQFMLRELGEQDRECIRFWLCLVGLELRVGEAKAAISNCIEAWHEWREGEDAAKVEALVCRTYQASISEDPVLTTLRRLWATLPGPVIDGIFDLYGDYSDAIPTTADAANQGAEAYLEFVQAAEHVPVITEIFRLVSAIAYDHTLLLQERHHDLVCIIPAPTPERLHDFLCNPLKEAVWSAVKAGS